MARGSLEFAVTDVETTGLFPGGTDRIIEIAIVRVNQDGTVLDEYCTLVNPGRDVGPTHVHGIHAGDLLEAPVFDEIVGDVLALVAGAVFVAHNVSFDRRFLRTEMTRAGHELPGFPELCTMRLARLADSTISSRRLSDLCWHFDVDPGLAHSALDDARATASLLATCIRRLSQRSRLSLSDMGVRGETPDPGAWPSLPPSGRTLVRAEAARRRSKPSYISELVSRLPIHATTAHEVVDYQALLDRALEDRRLSPEECEALDALASELGLSRDEAIALHEDYLFELLRVALEDGVISDSEAEDLQEVRRLLGVTEATFTALREKAEAAPASAGSRSAAEDLAGKTICFTGAMQCVVNGVRAERRVAEALAVTAGMILKTGVSKKLDILVLADPDSMSGKARRARSLNVRLVAEAVFWHMVGVQAE